MELIYHTIFSIFRFRIQVPRYLQIFNVTASMKRISTILIAIAILSVMATSCKPDPEEVEKDILTQWIWDVMNEIYLWSDDVDQNLFPTEEDPKDFFYQLLNPNDRFSWIVDDHQGLINSFNNVELSNGISPYFIRVSDSDNVIVIVEYVAKDSPADIAGIMRGDIITDINGTEIDIDNYIDLFYSEVATLTFAYYSNGAIIANGVEHTLTAVVIDQNPVNHYEIINYENNDIGYIAYTHFTAGEGDKWLDSLDYIFAELQTEGVKELIVDLRYNPGGSVYLALHIASMISPATVPGNNNPFVNFKWNNLYQNYFIQEDGVDSDNLVIFFEEAPSYNLDLSSVYFLTTSHSASASELLLIGLDPYMDVVQIGEYTYGKCYGSITIADTEEPIRHEWAMQPIVFKFANALGYTDFLDGIPPDYDVEDFLLEAKPFGDITDPQLAKALELITGVSPIVKKSQAVHVQYELLADPVREMKNRAVLEGNVLR